MYIHGRICKLNLGMLLTLLFIALRFKTVLPVTYVLNSISSSTSQEIHRMSRNRKVSYRVCKCQSPVPIPIQINPVHAPTSNFLKIHLNIILPSTLGTYKWSLSLKFPHQNFACISSRSHSCFMPCHSFISILSPKYYLARITRN